MGLARRPVALNQTTATAHPRADFTSNCTHSYLKLGRLWRELAPIKNWRNPRRGGFAQFWGPPSRAGEWSFNATRVLDADGTDAASLSRAEVEGRLQVYELMERFLRPRVPGFEQSFVAWTAAKIGVRETRRIVGEYVLTEEDIWNFRKFPDVINCGSCPIDIHLPGTNGKDTDFPDQHFYGGKYWTIPYRSLLPVKVDNLLVAGRCLSATHEALSAVRCIANTTGMGEAAGTAAALSLRHGVAPRALEVSILQRELLSRRVWLGVEGAAD
jgi:hypothetical protein